MTWQATVISAYPDTFPGVLAHGVTGRGLRLGKWQCTTVDVRSFALDKHHTIDGAPVGGGSGMILRADVLGRAHDAAVASMPAGSPTVVLSPRGRAFRQNDAQTLARLAGVILVCGRFEGIDERFVLDRADHCWSVGDYILSGGELAAMVVLDATVRLLGGVVGNPASLVGESFGEGAAAAAPPAAAAVQHAHYTLPRVWNGLAIPEVLLGGDHAAVQCWREREAAAARARREDSISRRGG